MTFTPAAAHLSSILSASAHAPVTHVVALRYTWPAGGASPAYTAGSVVAWAWALLGLTGSWGVQILRLPEGHDPQPADFRVAGATATMAAPAPAQAAPSSLDAPPPATWPDAVRDALVQLLRGCRPVVLDAQRYEQYVAFHKEWSQGVKEASRGKGRALKRD